MKEKEFSQSQGVYLPPTWCSGICRNAMNEVCLENCAIKRDCSGFDPKPNLKLEDMPPYPLKDSAGMTKEEKFTAVTVYLAKVVDHLKGVADEYTNYPLVRKQDLHRAGSRSLPENLKVEDLLSSVQEANSTLEIGEKREDSGVGPSEVAGTTD